MYTHHLLRYTGHSTIIAADDVPKIIIQCEQRNTAMLNPNTQQALSWMMQSSEHRLGVTGRGGVTDAHGLIEQS